VADGRGAAETCSADAALAVDLSLDLPVLSGRYLRFNQDNHAVNIVISSERVTGKLKHPSGGADS
jgi:hypothetical protein